MTLQCFHMKSLHEKFLVRFFNYQDKMLQLKWYDTAMILYVKINIVAKYVK